MKGMLLRTLSALALLLLLAAMPLRSQEIEYGRGGKSLEILPSLAVQVEGAGVQDAFPERWDWREHGGVTPVKHQRSCNTCSIFAAVGQFESALAVQGMGALDLSENQVKECNWEATGCSEAVSDMQVTNHLVSAGTVLEACDPYAPEDQGVCKTDCPYQHTALQWSIISTSQIPSVETLKHYIHTFGPVRTSFYAGDYGDVAWANQVNNYTGGVLHRPGAVSYTNHAVLLIGWDDTLAHAGGAGAWIAKNSWGTLWGSTCDLGTEKGYFNIAYDSANIGWHSSVISEWQEHDPTGQLTYHDEAGITGWAPGFLSGYVPNGTGWGLVVLDMDRDTYVVSVEFWTFDATSDVDVYLYRGFDGLQPSVLLRSSVDHQFAEAGYHRVVIAPPMRVSGGDDLVVVVKTTNAAEVNKIISADLQGPVAGQSYFSPDGAAGSWSLLDDRDVGIRARTSDAVEVYPLYLPLAQRGG